MQIFPDSPLSLWLDTYGDYSPDPPISEDITVDTAIIGGGFTGVATARELKLAEPGMSVALIESKTIGYGASGRNGSFAMTVVGLGFGVTAMLRGKEYVREAHHYMMRAVDHLDELITFEKLECDKIRPGFLRAATTPGYVNRLKHDIELMNSLGFDDISWIESKETRSRVNSERYLGAMLEPRLLLVNPAKLVRQEKDLAKRHGVKIYENTPVIEINSKNNFILKTPRGAVTAEKLVFATNAYSHLFPDLKRKQIPAFTYMIATEPLSSEQLEPIGWLGQEGVEDARNLIHYYRITPDKRVVIGGGPVGLTYANDLHGDESKAAWNHLENHLRFLFPSLANVKISHRWGGPFSVTVTLTPAMGYIKNKNAVYSIGCIGHGVSMSHLNAKTMCDMLLERQTDLTDSPFVNPRVIPWPPEPLRIITAGALRGYLKLEDWYYERGLTN